MQGGDHARQGILSELFFGKMLKCQPAALEQKPVHHFGVLQEKRVEFVRGREDQMEVLHRKQLRLALVYPQFFFDALAGRTIAVAARVHDFLDQPTGRAGQPSSAIEIRAATGNVAQGLDNPSIGLALVYEGPEEPVDEGCDGELKRLHKSLAGLCK